MFNLSMMSGTIYSIQRNMKLQAEFAKRRQNGFKKEEQTSDPQKDSMLKQLRDLQEQNENLNKSNTVSSIQSKLESGKKLSPTEMKYLKENSPELYEKAVKVQKDREQYERELKCCKTKDDVNRLHNQKMLSAASELATIKNSKMSPEEKLSYCRFINAKVNSATAVYDEFTSSEKYEKMPTDAEKAKEAEEKNVSASEQTAESIKAEDTEDNDKVENTEDVENAGEKPAVSKADTTSEQTVAELSDMADSKADSSKADYDMHENDNLLMKYPFMLEHNDKNAGRKMNITV